MRRSIVGLIMLAALASGCVSRSGSSAATAIFREVQIEGAAIQLGAPLPSQIQRDQPSDTIVALSRMQFGGAEAIRVHVTPAGVVRSLWFDYGMDADFDAMVANYASTLGPPTREAFRRGERVVWLDEATRFEVVRDPERSAATVYSILTDRALTAAPPRS